jgi:uncharacterized membrane protein
VRQLLHLVLLFLILLGGVASAQVNYNQRDDKYRLLGLKRAKEVYETARRDYERQNDLYAKGLISQAELDRGRSVFADAEVNYQQSLLAVLFEAQYVSVARAVKFKTQEGANHVRLQLVNTSGGGSEFQKLLNIDEALFRTLQPEVINNVYISITNDQGAIISQPFEAKIAELRYGQPLYLDFKLLQDLDVVTVNLIYGNGSSRTMKIYLQKDASVNKVIVQSEQFSQEAELGKSATFDLTLELFSGANNTFSLETVNLPRQINRFFKDPSGQARLSQFKFTESANTRKAALEISLPDRPTDEVAMDVPIPFYVLVVPRAQAAKLGDLSARHMRQEEIEKLGVGFVKLELVPRGKGTLLVRAPQLFHSMKPGGEVEMTIELVNEGSRRLDNIDIKVDQPVNWQKVIQPAIVPVLEIGAEQRVTLRFIPPANIETGRYDMRIRTSGMSDNQPVNGEDKSVTVEVQAEANIIGTIVIILLIVGLVGGIVVFGIKLSRK